MKNIAIIPAGGIGSRFKSAIPKQYVKVLGKELIVYTLEVFQNCEFIDEIIISAARNYFSLLADIKQKYGLTKIVLIVEGGKERHDSVFNAIKSKDFSKDDLILVHDAARPLLSEKLLKKAVESAQKFDSVVVALKARDTLIKESNDYAVDYLNRNEIYYAQTPQIFRYSILISAFAAAENEKFIGTDESMLVKRAGFDVKIVDGEFENFKVTDNSDLNIFTKMVNTG